MFLFEPVSKVNAPKYKRTKALHVLNIYIRFAPFDNTISVLSRLEFDAQSSIVTRSGLSYTGYLYLYVSLIAFEI